MDEEHAFIVTMAPSKQRRLANVVLMLAHRLRRWPTIKMTLVERLLFAGLQSPMSICSHLKLYPLSDITANTKHLYDIYTTSAHRLRRWSNVV